MLHGYRPTHLETCICQLYLEQGFHLDFHAAAAIWGVQIIYNALPAFSFWVETIRFISLDSRTNAEQQRADFYHELGHLVLHDGRQLGLHTLMVQLQEWQAQRFQLIAAMPYVLFPPERRTWDEYAWLLSQTFAVPADVAARRVEMIQARRPIYEGRR